MIKNLQDCDHIAFPIVVQPLSGPLHHIFFFTIGSGLIVLEILCCALSQVGKDIEIAE